jgi:hypothetical protein
MRSNKMNRENIEEILKSIGSEDVPAEVRKIAQETSRDFSEPLMRPRQHVFLEYIMKSQITKLAAAAVIVIAVLIGLSIIPTGPSGVVWADVVKHVEGIKTVAYHMRATMKGLAEMATDKPINIEMQAKFAYDYGFRIDSCMHVENRKITTNTYVLFDEGAIVTVVPQEKKYAKLKLTNDILKKMEKENGDPRTMLREMMKNEYTKLGFKTINDTEVEGIEVTDPAMGGGMFDEIVVQLWCDVETDLPVLMTMKGSAKNGEVLMDMVMDNYEWDAEFDTAELEPNIPDDYELLVDTEFGVGKDGKDFVEALEFFAEFADGKYPSTLTGMSVMKEFTDVLQVKFASDPPSDDGPSEEIMENIVKLQSIGMTYAMMVKDGNDPAYYGDKVTTEFPHAVLMRWKIADDTYRVIFGDLTIEDASSEELAELEALPLNLKSFAINPEPSDGTVGTSLEGMKLSWIPGAYATGHRVYFGTTSDELVLLAEVTEPNYTELPALERETTYYWRVDEVQSDGSVVTGDIWSFNTGGLVAWWKLDDGTGDVATDSAGSGHDGTLVGDTTWADGKIGAALVFDGNDDYIEIGKDPDFDITNQITVAAWIKGNAFDREWQTVISKGDSSWRLQRNQNKGSLEFACTGVVVPGTRWSNILGTVDVNDGQWHHIAGTYDGSQVCLYVDGTLDVSSNSIGGSIKITDQPVLIGENAEKPKRFWNGLIDDVRVYSYALSTADIEDLCEDTFKPVDQTQ